jgi:hypothetical protein
MEIPIYGCRVLVGGASAFAYSFRHLGDSSSSEVGEGCRIEIHPEDR